MRLFVGVPLSDELKTKLESLVSELKKTLIKPQVDITWTPMEQVHFTLKFIGDAVDEQLPAIEHALAQAAESVAPFTITAGGVGRFPPQGMARILWLGVQAGGERVQELAGGVEKALEPLGFPSEERPFVPHATLGRLRSIRDMAILQAPLEKYRGSPLGQMSVSSIALVQSRLSSVGPEHTIRKELQLNRYS